MPHLLGPPHFIYLADLLRTVALRSCLFGNHLPVLPGDTVGMAYSYVSFDFVVVYHKMGAS